MLSKPQLTLVGVYSRSSQKAIYSILIKYASILTVLVSLVGYFMMCKFWDYRSIVYYNIELWLVEEYSSSSQKAIFSSSNKPVFWQCGFSCMFKYSKEEVNCVLVQFFHPGSPLKANFAQEDHKNFATFSSFSFLTQSEGGTSWKEGKHEIIPLLPFYSI